jgi:hypothetical protein
VSRPRPHVILTWISSIENQWCTLGGVDLSGVRAVGVYLIWYSGGPGRVVCIGQGDIAAQLRALRSEGMEQTYESAGELLVTWAQVSPGRIDGIMRYLAETWPPIVPCPTGDAAAIEVNSPGWMRAFV